MKKILLINGPNLQLLGKREPQIYGTETLASIVKKTAERARQSGFVLEHFQSNSEGAIVDRIGQTLEDGTCGIIINPAAYTHTSVAILDALKAVALPAVEVHLSDVSQRESFRHISYPAMACLEQIKGLGFQGYEKAILLLKEHLNK